MPAEHASFWLALPSIAFAIEVVAPVSHRNFSWNLDPPRTRCVFEGANRPSVLGDLSGENESVDFSAPECLWPFNCENLRLK